jgi:hypothetical protein
MDKSMHAHTARLLLVAVMAVIGLSSWTTAQTSGQPEEFTAVAIVNNNLGSGAGTVLIDVDRWSSEKERMTLANTLLQKGADKLLDALQDMRPVGRIRTPDSLGYDLRYAHQQRGEDGGRRIVIATDRPIGFWEATRGTRTLDYPFTVIQMNIGRDGKGTGTMSYATKITAKDNTIELENFATSPVMLTEIQAKPQRD